MKNKDGLPKIKDTATLYRELKAEELLKKGTSFSEFKTQYLRYASKAIKDTNLKIILKLSKTDRKEKLKDYKSTMKPSEYTKLIQSLRQMGIPASN